MHRLLNSAPLRLLPRAYPPSLAHRCGSLQLLNSGLQGCRVVGRGRGSRQKCRALMVRPSGCYGRAAAAHFPSVTADHDCGGSRPGGPPCEPLISPAQTGAFPLALSPSAPPDRRLPSALFTLCRGRRLLQRPAVCVCRRCGGRGAAAQPRPGAQQVWRVHSHLPDRPQERLLPLCVSMGAGQWAAQHRRRRREARSSTAAGGRAGAALKHSIRLLCAGSHSPAPRLIHPTHLPPHHCLQRPAGSVQGPPAGGHWPPEPPGVWSP